MAQYSQPWDGTDIGHAASRAPYNEQEWDEMWETWFGSLAEKGVVPGVDNELEVTDAGGTVVDVDTGCALVKGKWYRNTTSVSMAAIPAATGGNWREDCIVLRCSWALKTVTIERHENANENAAWDNVNLTQVEGTTWEIPLAAVRVSDAAGGPDITLLTDLREEVYGPAVDRFFGPEAFSGFLTDPADKDANFDYWLFEPTAQDESIVLYWRVPDQYRGESFRIWVYWTGTAAPGANDQVYWIASMNWLVAGDDTSAFIPVCVESAIGVLPAADELVITELTGGNCHLVLEAGEMLRLWITRLATNVADTYASDAVLFGVRIKMF